MKTGARIGVIGGIVAIVLGALQIAGAFGQVEPLIPSTMNFVRGEIATAQMELRDRFATVNAEQQTIKELVRGNTLTNLQRELTELELRLRDTPLDFLLTSRHKAVLSQIRTLEGRLLEESP